MKKSFPSNLDHGIATLLIEANVNLMVAEWIYEKITDREKTDKTEFLRVMANNSCNSSLLILGSILAPQPTDINKNEFSISGLGEDPILEDIRNFYKNNSLENIRNKSIAHKDRNHPEPAWSLNSFIEVAHIKRVRTCLDKAITYFSQKYNWDLTQSSSWTSVLKWLSEILKSL